MPLNESHSCYLKKALSLPYHTRKFMSINYSTLKKRKHLAGLWVDVFMLLLIIVNLAFIIFDWHFQFAFFQRFLQNISPSFYTYYRDVVHPNFLLYDLFFVSIYIIELMASWIVAIKRKTYERWYFYPLIHWYDVLGCIPVGTFRWLRILRVVSILIRLNKLDMIDLTNTYVYRKGNKLYRIIMEEISDRVVIKILNGIEDEIKQDSPTTTRMVSEILKPHQETIARWLSHRIKKTVEQNYNQYKDDLKSYIEESIGEAVKQNREIKKISAIPIFGKKVADGLEHGVSNITYEAINGLVSGLTSEANEKVIKDAIHGALESVTMGEEDPELSQMMKDIVIRAIELVKEQVAVKQWKQIDANTKLALKKTA